MKLFFIKHPKLCVGLIQSGLETEIHKCSMSSACRKGTCLDRSKAASVMLAPHLKTTIFCAGLQIHKSKTPNRKTPNSVHGVWSTFGSGPLSVCLCVCLSLYLSLSFSLSSCLAVWLPAWLRGCLAAWLAGWLIGCLSVCDCFVRSRNASDS